MFLIVIAMVMFFGGQVVVSTRRFYRLGCGGLIQVGRIMDGYSSR